MLIHPSYTRLFTVLIMLLPFMAILHGQTVFPHDTRSDSVAIHHYEIHINTTNAVNNQLSGYAYVNFKPLVNGIEKLTLDLKGLQVDSIFASWAMVNRLDFVTGTDKFTTDLDTTFNVGDSAYILVYYHGTPVSDPVFGGFSFSGTYAYNIGVSLDQIPHNFGKTWFPCFDNFTTRSTYDLFITTLNTQCATSGGEFIGQFTNPNSSKTYHYFIHQTIPTYLVSVAVAPFVMVKDSYSSISGSQIPVELHALAKDTVKVKGSFANLEDAFHIYEDKWGAYRWDKVGYSFVPVNAGAMEHAMNIAYPIVLTTGDLKYETVMAHELSHHWWGNLVTCRTAEDMWINEGSASFCELVFTEAEKGRAAYETEVRTRHKDLLQNCHIDDGGYWPLSGVPQSHTYGSTTYKKGSIMLHTLRSYLGDQLFYTGLEDLLEQNKFTDMDAKEYRDKLGTITGTNLNNFFDSWIFQAGWPHVNIDSMKAVPAGANFNVTLYLRQKLVGRSNYSTNIPMQVTFRNNNFSTFETNIVSSGQQNTVTVTVTVTVPFNPTLAYLNRNELISHAVTGVYKTVDKKTTVTMNHANFTLQVQAITDSVFTVVEQHWAAPDPIKNNAKHWRISDRRFWRVDGIWNAGFVTNAKIFYNGAVNSGLDEGLITGVEDSIKLLYRENCSKDWMEYPEYTKAMGSTTDKGGNITILNLKKGEYAFGYRDVKAAISEKEVSLVRIYPNPAKDKLTIESEQAIDVVTIIDLEGKIVAQQTGSKLMQIDISKLSPGVYVINGQRFGNRVFGERFVVE